MLLLYLSLLSLKVGPASLESRSELLLASILDLPIRASLCCEIVTLRLSRISKVGVLLPDTSTFPPTNFSSATNRAVTTPYNTVFDVKWFIGRKFTDSTVQKDKKLHSFSTAKNGDKSDVSASAIGGDKALSPEERLVRVLTESTTNAEEYLGKEVKACCSHSSSLLQ